MLAISLPYLHIPSLLCVVGVRMRTGLQIFPVDIIAVCEGTLVFSESSIPFGKLIVFVEMITGPQVYIKAQITILKATDESATSSKSWEIHMNYKYTGIVDRQVGQMCTKWRPLDEETTSAARQTSAWSWWIAAGSKTNGSMWEMRRRWIEARVHTGRNMIGFRYLEFTPTPPTHIQHVSFWPGEHFDRYPPCCDCSQSSLVASDKESEFP